MTKLSSIEGIGAAYAGKLNQAGITSLESLLKTCCNKKGRQLAAKKCGLPESRLLEWVNRADLTRIKGVSTQYADLLECAGVDTVPELAHRKAANLRAKMFQVNQSRHLVRRVPSEMSIERWVAQAKTLPKMVTH